MTIKKILRIFSFNMTKIKIKEDYRLSNCCTPTPSSGIVGYYSHDNFIKVHLQNCQNLKNIDTERLISLDWTDILSVDEEFKVDPDYASLDEIDFKALQHHADYGIDYSHVVAKKLHISKQEGFDLHKKLRELLLIERVDAKIVQYRKGIVPNKWIKHRNHTYFDLTEKGRQYLKYFSKNAK